MVTSNEIDPTGSVETSAPPSATVGAFFDFDGTVAAGFTGALLPWDCLRRGEMSVGDLIATLWVAANFSLGRLDFEEFIRRGSLTLRGRHVDEMPALGQRLYEKYIAARIYPEMKDIIADHLARGHTVVLTTAAFHVQVAQVADALGIEHVLSNRCQIDGNSVLTGEVEKPILRGRTKAEAVCNFAADNGIDLGLSYFYADGEEDIPLMTAVGNPRPTNPDSGMARMANAENWPVLWIDSPASRAGLRFPRNVLNSTTIAAAPAVFGLAAAALRSRR